MTPSLRRRTLYRILCIAVWALPHPALAFEAEAVCKKIINVHIRHDTFFGNPADQADFNNVPTPNGCWRWERTRTTGNRFGHCDTNREDGSNLRWQPEGSALPPCKWYYDETRPNRPSTDTGAMANCWARLACSPKEKGVAYMIGTGAGWSDVGSTWINRWYAETYGAGGVHSAATYDRWKRAPVGRPMLSLKGLTAARLYELVNHTCMDKFANGNPVFPTTSWLGIYLGPGGVSGGGMVAGTPHMNLFVKALNDCTKGIRRTLSYSNQCSPVGQKSCVDGTTFEECLSTDEGDIWSRGSCGEGEVCTGAGECTVSPSCSNQCDSVVQKRCNGQWSENCGDWDGDGCLEWGHSEYCPNYGPTYVCGSNGACVNQPGCSNQCAPGTKRCNGQWSENCGDWTGDGCTEWGNSEYCPNYGPTYVCGASGYCVNDPPSCNQCTPGTKRCNGQWSENCGDWNGDGCAEWGNPEYCPNYGPGIHCNPDNGYCVGS